MSRRKDKRSLTQRKRNALAITLAGAIAEILTLVIQEILKEEKSP